MRWPWSRPNPHAALCWCSFPPRLKILLVSWRWCCSTTLLYPRIGWFLGSRCLRCCRGIARWLAGQWSRRIACGGLLWKVGFCGLGPSLKRLRWTLRILIVCLWRELVLVYQALPLHLIHLLLWLIFQRAHTVSSIWLFDLSPSFSQSASSISWSVIPSHLWSLQLALLALSFL